MGSTNHTANYNLSQFVGTDKPAWLQDYNGDMTKIDAGINAAKVAADSAALDAGAAQSDATAANTAITNTINPAITSLQNTVGTQGGAINTINSLIGNGTPTTTDQTIIGAINEINAEVSNAPSWSNNGDIFYRKSGNLVELNVRKDSVADGTVIGNIPLGYIPDKNINISNGINAEGGCIIITTDGEVTFQSSSGTHNVRIHVMYFV